MLQKQFLREKNFEMLIIETDVQKLLERMHAFIPNETPKWLKK